jgi:hypothetical protein
MYTACAGPVLVLNPGLSIQGEDQEVSAKWHRFELKSPKA